MATYTLKEIVGLFKAGKSLDGIVALEAYEASVSKAKAKGARVRSEARIAAARENGKRGGRPKSVRAAQDAGVVCEAVKAVAPRLPAGVVRGSDLEARK